MIQNNTCKKKVDKRVNKSILQITKLKMNDFEKKKVFKY